MSRKPTNTLLFDRQTLLKTLEALDRDLNSTARIIVVGGAFLALSRLRDGTRDVDSISRLGSAIKEAVHRVGESLDLAPDWLNDRAIAFVPQGMNLQDSSIGFEGRSLTVILPSPDWVFLMKLHAGRAVDRPDLIKLWPVAGFGSPAEAVERYWDAYPGAPEDEFLESFVVEVANSTDWVR